MLGNLLDTLPAADQRQDAAPRGLPAAPGAARFADHLSHEQQRHANTHDQGAKAGQRPRVSAGNVAAPAEPARGKALPPAAGERRPAVSERASGAIRPHAATGSGGKDTDGINTGRSNANNKADLAHDLDQRAHELRAADDTVLATDAPELARLLGKALGVVEADPEVDGLEFNQPEAAIAALKQFLAKTNETLGVISEGQVENLQPADSESVEDWLEQLTDEELAMVWLATLTGQENAVPDADVPALLAETRARPDFLALAQLDPNWVKIKTPDPEHLQAGSDQVVAPGLMSEGSKSPIGPGSENSDGKADLELANAKDAPLSERARFAQLADTLQARVSQESGRSSDEQGALRQSLDGQSPREATRQTVAELVKQHVERQIPVKNSASELTQRLSERMVMMIGQDIQEARIRLNPPEMGHLDVRVTTQNDQVHVHVVAQQPVVRDLLEQHAHRLREMLEQQGFTQVNVDVSDQGGGSDNQAQTSEQSGEAVADEAGAESDAGSATRQAVGLVDHYV